MGHAHSRRVGLGCGIFAAFLQWVVGQAFRDRIGIFGAGNPLELDSDLTLGVTDEPEIQ
jgi:hypothetical protein